MSLTKTEGGPDSSGVRQFEANYQELFSPSSRPESLGLLGHYDVLKVLGRGGFGTVFQAFDTKLHREVAIKLLNPKIGPNSAAGVRFLREARAAATIRNENVVQIYSVEEKPAPYLVMEYVPGQSLQDMIDHHGRLPTRDGIAIGAQIARGLAAAHARGLIHRDLKPANILVEKGDDGYIAKLADFGLALSREDTRLTQSGMIVGTPIYMAPEQTRGEELDHRTDLFSLGSVLYTMLGGDTPFGATDAMVVLNRINSFQPKPLQQLAPETPAWLCEVVRKLHAKDRAGRYQSASEVAEIFEKAQSMPRNEAPTTNVSPRPTPGDRSGETESDDTPAYLGQFQRKFPWWTIALGVLLSGLAIGAAIVMRPGGSAESSTTRKPDGPVTPPKSVVAKSDIAKLWLDESLAWSKPEKLGPEINGGATRVLFATLTSDEKTIVFFQENKGEKRLMIGTRNHRENATFQDVQALPDEINQDVNGPSYLSPDGSALLFVTTRERPNLLRIWKATRTPDGATYTQPEKYLEPVDTADMDTAPILSADGTKLFTTSYRKTPKVSGDILEFPVINSKPNTKNASLLPPPISTPVYETPCWLSPDDCVMVMLRMPTSRPEECRFHVRATPTDPFGEATPFRGLEEFQVGRPWFSPDGRRMYFHIGDGVAPNRIVNIYTSRLEPKK